MSKILVVEDEKDIADLLTLHLKREGHEVSCVYNGENVFKKVEEKKDFNLMIIDWMLPGVSGLEVCKRLRFDESKYFRSRIPILMLTARAESADIILGLEMGADDYLCKPFEMDIFLARVRALLRRGSMLEASPKTTFQLGALFVNTENYQVKCNKKEISLTPSEYKLLLALLKNQGRVLTRDELIDLVQGDGVSVIDRAIDTHIFGLRKKLGHECADIIETIRGIGYRVKASE